MPNQDLLDYIKNELALGIAKKTIQNTLINAGWTIQDIDTAWNSIGKNTSPSQTFASESVIHPQKNFMLITSMTMIIALTLAVGCYLYFTSPQRIVRLSFTNLDALIYLHTTVEINSKISSSTNNLYTTNKIDAEYDFSEPNFSSNISQESTIQFSEPTLNGASTTDTTFRLNELIRNVAGETYYNLVDSTVPDVIGTANSIMGKWVNVTSSYKDQESLSLIGFSVEELQKKLQQVEEVGSFDTFIKMIAGGVTNPTQCRKCIKKIDDSTDKNLVHYKFTGKIPVKSQDRESDNALSLDKIFRFADVTDKDIESNEVIFDLWINKNEKLPFKMVITHSPIIDSVAETNMSVSIVFENLATKPQINTPENAMTIQRIITDLFINGTLDPYAQVIALSDFDLDGIPNTDELSIYETNMESGDTNSNGINDSDEIYKLYQKDAQNNINYANDDKRDSLIYEYLQASSIHPRHTVQESYDNSSDLMYNPYVELPQDLIREISKAYTYRASGSFKDSLTILEKSLTLHKDYTGIIYHHIGLTYVAIGKSNEALNYYKIAQDSGYESVLLYYDLAVENLKLGFKDKYIYYLTDGIRKYPKYFKFYVMLAEYYIDAKNFTEAKKIVEDGLKQGSRYADLLNILGLIYDNEKNYVRAEEYYKKATSSDFHKYTTHINLSILYREKLRTSDNFLLKTLTEALLADDFNPNYSNAKNVLGLAFAENNNPDRAILEYKKAIALDPTYDKPYNNIGIAYSMKGLFTLEEQSFRKAIELNPRYAKAYSNLGSAYINQGLKTSFANNEHLKAKSNLEKAIAIEADYLAYQGLGRVYLAMATRDPSYYEQTEYYFKKSIELKYDDQFSHRQLGFVYFNQGKREDAIKEWRIAKTLGLRDDDVDMIIKNIESGII